MMIETQAFCADKWIMRKKIFPWKGQIYELCGTLRLFVDFVLFQDFIFLSSFQNLIETFLHLSRKSSNSLKTHQSLCSQVASVVFERAKAFWEELKTIGEQLVVCPVSISSESQFIIVRRRVKSKNQVACKNVETSRVADAIFGSLVELVLWRALWSVQTA
jgi:hypothetical protein